MHNTSRTQHFAVMSSIQALSLGGRAGNSNTPAIYVVPTLPAFTAVRIIAFWTKP